MKIQVSVSETVKKKTIKERGEGGVEGEMRCRGKRRKQERQRKRR